MNSNTSLLLAYTLQILTENKTIGTNLFCYILFRIVDFEADEIMVTFWRWNNISGCHKVLATIFLGK